MHSTIYAVCYDTNRIAVLAGSEGRWKYKGRMPPTALMPPDGEHAEFRALAVRWKDRVAEVVVVVLPL